MKSKKVLIAGIGAAVAVATIAGSSIAYFTSKDQVSNTFTVGNVKIQLTEPKWVPTDQHVIMPATEFEKDPTVKNIGKNDAYIRVNVKISDYAAIQGAGLEGSSLLTGLDSANWTPTGAAGVVDSVNDTITYSYYYNKTIAANESTTPVFTKVSFPSTLKAADLQAIGDDFKIDVSADAIQAESFSNVQAAFTAFDNE